MLTTSVGFCHSKLTVVNSATVLIENQAPVNANLIHSTGRRSVGNCSFGIDDRGGIADK